MEAEGQCRHDRGARNLRLFVCAGSRRVAMDAGAQRVLIPTENSRDFATLPAEVLDKLRIEFYSEPSQAAFKALAE
jgi:ATP-dependent Lon protease